MVLHVLIFLTISGIALLTKTGRLPGWKTKGFRLFFIIAAAGNLLGLFLTLQEKAEADRTDLRIARMESSYGMETWTVSVEDKEPENVTVRIPRKDTGQEEEDFLPDPHDRRRQELQDMIESYNQDKGDPDYYYLPETWDGKTLVWKRKEEHTGQLLAGFLLTAGVMLMILDSREKEKAHRKRMEQLAAEYPALIMKFTLLLQAGLSPQSAFARIGKDYEARESSRRNLACEEILVLLRETQSGVSETEAYRRLGGRCGEVRYRTLSALLTQNLRKGTRFLTDALEREAVDAWEERKRNARVQGEMTSTRLLIPMLLMLLVVIAVILIPAFLSFYQ